jgi:HlyD family secretion protein
LVVFGIVVLVALGAIVLRTAGGASAQEEAQTATAREGTLVVTVGGVGRIVEAHPTIQVFPRAAGIVSDVRVSRGEKVAAGEVIAVLDDGGTAAAATDQAEADLAAAQVDLRQRRAARPSDRSAARQDLKRAKADLQALLGGSEAAQRRAIRLAEQNVALAQKRFDQLQAPPSTADVRAAEAEVRRAEAALATLTKPQPGPLPEVLAAAQQAVVVARQNLARAQATGTPAEINAAQLDLYRAQAELAALQQPPAAPLAEEVAAAQAAVESARENLRRLYAPPKGADVASAQLELDRARADLAQLRSGPSHVSVAAAQQAVAAASERLEQSKSPFSVDLAREGVAGARARLTSARAAEQQLTVRAPAAGVVTALTVAPGSVADTATSIATLASLDDVAVTVDLSEFDVAQVELGQKAAVSVDALGGEEYAGQVTYVAPSGTETSGLVTFPVQVALRSAEDVKPGMNVSVRIVVARVENAVLVPLEAVTRDEEDNTFVTVVDDSGAEKERAVVVGLSNNKSTQIVRGLEAGDEVLLAEVAAPAEEE